jgi:hypothetical protein
MSIIIETEGNTYDYRISFDSVKILEEILFHYPSGRRALVFSRNGGSFKFGRAVSRGQSQISAMTSPNSSYLAVAAQLNNEICKNVHNWFVNDLVILSPMDEGILTEMFIKKMNSDDRWKTRALSALQKADFGITDIHGTVETKNIRDVHMPPYLKGMLTALGTVSANEMELYMVHDVNVPGLLFEDKRFPVQIESNGTMRFLSLIGPIIDALSEGKTLMVDEMGSRLHSSVVEWIVKLFGDPEQNTGKGQLIFNTHNNLLLDLDVLRRDQIYLFDKDAATGASEMFSLSDFGERKDKPILRGYLDGRYGAIPFISEGKI